MAWEDVAQAVINRRVELGMRTRQRLADETDLSVKTLGELERAERKSYDPATLAVVEQALKWPSGRIKAIADHGIDAVTHAPDGSVTVMQGKDHSGEAPQRIPARLPAPVVDLIHLLETLDGPTHERLLDAVASLVALTREARSGRTPSLAEIVGGQSGPPREMSAEERLERGRR